MNLGSLLLKPLLHLISSSSSLRLLREGDDFLVYPSLVSLYLSHFCTLFLITNILGSCGIYRRP